MGGGGEATEPPRGQPRHVSGEDLNADDEAEGPRFERWCGQWVCERDEGLQEWLSEMSAPEGMRGRLVAEAERPSWALEVNADGTVVRQRDVSPAGTFGSATIFRLDKEVMMDGGKVRTSLMHDGVGRLVQHTIIKKHKDEASIITTTRWVRADGRLVTELRMKGAPTTRSLVHRCIDRWPLLGADESESLSVLSAQRPMATATTQRRRQEPSSSGAEKAAVPPRAEIARAPAPSSSPAAASQRQGLFCGCFGGGAMTASEALPPPALSAESADAAKRARRERADEQRKERDAVGNAAAAPYLVLQKLGLKVRETANAAVYSKANCYEMGALAERVAGLAEEAALEARIRALEDMGVPTDELPEAKRKNSGSGGIGASLAAMGAAAMGLSDMERALARLERALKAGLNLVWVLGHEGWLGRLLVEKGSFDGDAFTAAHLEIQNAVRSLRWPLWRAPTPFVRALYQDAFVRRARSHIRLLTEIPVELGGLEAILQLEEGLPLLCHLLGLPDAYLLQSERDRVLAPLRAVEKANMLRVTWPRHPDPLPRSVALRALFSNPGKAQGAAGWVCRVERSDEYTLQEAAESEATDASVSWVRPIGSMVRVMLGKPLFIYIAVAPSVEHCSSDEEERQPHVCCIMDVKGYLAYTPVSLEPGVQTSASAGPLVQAAKPQAPKSHRACQSLFDPSTWGWVEEDGKSTVEILEPTDVQLEDGTPLPLRARIRLHLPPDCGELGERVELRLRVKLGFYASAEAARDAVKSPNPVPPSAYSTVTPSLSLSVHKLRSAKLRFADVQDALNDQLVELEPPRRAASLEATTRHKDLHEQKKKQGEKTKKTETEEKEEEEEEDGSPAVRKPAEVPGLGGDANYVPSTVSKEASAAAFGGEETATDGSAGQNHRHGLLKEGWRAALTAEEQARMDSAFEFVKRIGDTALDEQIPDRQSGEVEWKECTKPKAQIKAWTLRPKGELPIVVVKTRIQAPAVVVADFLTCPVSRQLWDDLLLVPPEVLAKPNPRCKRVQLVYRGQWPISNREVTVFNALTEHASGEILCAARSTSVQQLFNSSHVLAEVFHASYLIRPLPASEADEEGHEACEIAYVQQLFFGPSLPRQIMDMIIADQPRMLGEVRRLCEMYMLSRRGWADKRLLARFGKGGPAYPEGGDGSYPLTLEKVRKEMATLQKRLALQESARSDTSRTGSALFPTTEEEEEAGKGQQTRGRARARGADEESSADDDEELEEERRITQ